MVVRNRLEQLRKRQRDEALQAQEELLAGVARSAAGGDRVVPEIDATNEETVVPEDMEPYHRLMSPALLDIRKLPYEERQIDIVTEMEDLRAIVSYSTPVLLFPVSHLDFSSWSSVVQ